MTRRRIVQLDGDPVEDRKQVNGRWRPMLNNKERKELKGNQTLNQAMALFITQGRTPADIAQEMGMTIQEFAQLLLHGDDTRGLYIQRALDMILDLDSNLSRREIAEYLGITQRQLKALMITDEFREMYALAFTEVRGDPIIPEIQRRIVEDLLPTALRQLTSALTEAPWTVRMRAIERIMALSGVKEITAQTNDRDEAAKFLSSHNVLVTVQTSPVPKEFQEAVALLAPDIVEGEITEIEDIEES